MRQSNLQEVAQARTDKNAVEFDQNIRYSKEKAWPFWYGFIPRLFLNESTFRGGLGPLGWKILPGEVKDIHIKTRRDTAYRLLGVKYTPYICIDDVTDNPLTGTVTLVLNSADVVGVGTSFTTEINIGQTLAIDDGGGGFVFFSVKSITDNTNLVLDEVSTVASAGAAFSLASKIWYDRTLPNSVNIPQHKTNAPGTISIPATTANMTGVSTQFNTAPNDLVAGDVIEYSLDDNSSLLNTIATVTDDTTATVSLTNTQAVTTRMYRHIGEVAAGTITVTAATGVVVGVGTTFTSHTVGSLVYYVVGGAVITGVILSITDNLNMNLQILSNLVDAAAVGYAAGIVGAVNPSLPLPINNFLFNPTNNLLTVTIILTSLQNRFLLGGNQYRPGSGLLERPENITALQGQDDGMGFIRTAALLPAEATVIVRITNNSSTETIIVNGALFGYKVSINEVSKH